MRLVSLFVVGALVVGCSAGERKAEKAQAKAETKADAKPEDSAPEAEDAHDEEGKAVPAKKPRTWSFADAEVGKVPAGLTIGETNPHNHPATWEIVEREDAPSPPKAFGVTKCDNPKAAVFEVALIDDTSYGDLEAEVWMFAGPGEFDQGGGLVWRAKDIDNYYVARWNPIENNLRFYVVVDSERSKLAEVDVELDTSKWHRMHLVVEGSHFEVSLDDGAPLTLDDSTLTEPGKVGFWTKTDAKTLFDDLSVTES
jgi:hypothetical protein